jgi:hypothetical protein
LGFGGFFLIAAVFVAGCEGFWQLGDGLVCLGG